MLWYQVDRWQVLRITIKQNEGLDRDIVHFLKWGTQEKSQESCGPFRVSARGISRRLSEPKQLILSTIEIIHFTQNKVPLK